MNAPRKVTDDDMPQLFKAADKTSLDAQQQYVNGARIRLSLLILWAAAGAKEVRVGESHIDVLSIIGTLFCVGALLVEGLLWRGRPDKTWYDARAVAESAKTLAWKFAVRGEPFSDESLSEPEMVRKLMAKLQGIREQFRDLDLAEVDAKAVSEWMCDQRRAPWDERRQVYLTGRVQDQKRWYAAKAAYNRRRSTQWRVALVVLEFIGVVTTLVVTIWREPLLLTPALAAIIVAAVAWMETKQHDFNGRAYSAAVADLAQAETKLEIATSEQEWATEVNNAEDAMSREHTLWLASRTEFHA